MIVSKNLVVGKAAEFLVCYDLSLRGVRASLSPFEGSPYDVIGEYGGVMVKVQVKGASRPSDTQYSGGRSRYRWYHKESNAIADLIAYVALDIGKVIYEVPPKNLKREKTLSLAGIEKASGSEKALAAVFGPIRAVE